MEVHHPCGWPNKKVALKVPDNFMVTCMDHCLNKKPYSNIKSTENKIILHMYKYVVAVEPFVCNTSARQPLELQNNIMS